MYLLITTFSAPIYLRLTRLGSSTKKIPRPLELADGLHIQTYLGFFALPCSCESTNYQYSSGKTYDSGMKEKLFFGNFCLILRILRTILSLRVSSWERGKWFTLYSFAKRSKKYDLPAVCVHKTSQSCLSVCVKPLSSKIMRTRRLSHFKSLQKT